MDYRRDNVRKHSLASKRREDVETEIFKGNQCRIAREQMQMSELRASRAVAQLVPRIRPNSTG